MRELVLPCHRQLTGNIACLRGIYVADKYGSEVRETEIKLSFHFRAVTVSWWTFIPFTELNQYEEVGEN